MPHPQIKKPHYCAADCLARNRGFIQSISHTYALPSAGLGADEVAAQCREALLTTLHSLPAGLTAGRVDRLVRARMRGAVIDERRRQMPIDRARAKERNHYVQVVDQLQMDLGREPTNEEVADSLGVSMAGLYALRERITPRVYLPLDHPDTMLENALVLPGQRLPAEEADRTEIRDELHAAMQNLSSQERTVLTLSFFEDRTYAEISSRLKLTKGRISQVRSRALRHLRRLMEKSQREIVAC